MPNENDAANGGLDDRFTLNNESAESFGLDDASLMDALDPNAPAPFSGLEPRPGSSAESVSSDPFVSSSMELDPGLDASLSAAPNLAATAEVGKKGKKEKKAKKEKAPKVKAAKPKKEKPAKVKAPKAPRAPRPEGTSSAPVWLLGLLLLLGIVGVNALAFMSFGADAFMYMIVFNALALFLLAAPALLLLRLRDGALTIFDAFLAFSAIFIVISAMIVFSYQAKTYGSSSKTASSLPAVARHMTLDC